MENPIPLEDNQEIEEFSSPVREEWPKDSLLTPDHFTIDHQHCLTCGISLGYAMPMNKIPKSKYLRCLDCGKQDYLKCVYCGNLIFPGDPGNGFIVSHPANCAYTSPTEIFQYMCAHCFNEEKANQPSHEEIAKIYHDFRNERRRQEELEKLTNPDSDSCRKRLRQIFEEIDAAPDPKKPKKIVRAEKIFK